MADMIDAEQLRAMKSAHPGAVAVCYVNSTAEVKAECDICVTSGNAEKIMATFPKDREVIFVPDQHLGSFVMAKFNAKYILWPGYCPTHARLTAASVKAARSAHPGAMVMVHPECRAEVRDASDAVLSTGGMCHFAKTSPANEFIVGTEIGLLHRLRAENTSKTFYPMDDAVVCPNMKKTTLDNLARSLRDMTTRVTVAEPISSRARAAIEAMLAVK